MKMKTKAKVVDLESVRRALADYMMSEGCRCCEGRSHDADKARLAELLQVPLYSDGSGFDFNRYATNPVH